MSRDHLKGAGYALIGASLGILLVVAASLYSKSDKTTADLSIYVDDETGCEYLKLANSLTPRLNKAGQPICNERIYENRKLLPAT